MKNHIRFILFFSLSLFFYSCNNNHDNKKPVDVQKEVTLAKEAATIDTTHKENIDSVDENKSIYTDYAVYFIIIADTGKDYFSLRNKMFELNKSVHLSIDTLGRYYNKKKNLIALPDNAKVELYAGEYFPRRFPSESMSLEYLSYYQKESDKKTIALVTGVYENEKEADDNYNKLIQSGIKPIKMKTKMYVGCIH